MSKYFPINTQTACRLKWAWSTLYLNSGQTSSCHRASHGTLNENNFDSFHNTPEKLHARQQMLQGQWPDNGCEYCRDIEIVGGHSDRMFQNQVPDVYPDVLDQSPTQISVEPSILEVFFSNTCNFKCVYCKSSLSSAIQAEELLYGSPIIPLKLDHRPNQYKNLAPRFWQWFENNSHKLMRLQILGGEPLLQKDFAKLLDFFDNDPHPDLEVNIVTNLGVPSNILSLNADRMASLLSSRKVKRIDIQVSIDGWGPAQQYVRKGLDLDLWENNLQTLMKHKIFRIGLLSTICSLTIKEMPALVAKYNQWNQQHEIFWYMHHILPAGTSIFDPEIFDFRIFQYDLEQTFSNIPDLTWDNHQTKKTLRGLIDRIEKFSFNDRNRHKDLLMCLNEIDRRRDSNWQKTFPWLSKEIENVV
jgi:organic radical activating enzyme